MLAVIFIVFAVSCKGEEPAKSASALPSSSLPSSSQTPSSKPQSDKPSSSEPSDVSSGQVSRPESKPGEDIENTVTPPEDTLHKNHYCYSLLTDVQKVYYEAMHTAVEQMTASWIVLGPHTEKYAADIAVVRSALVSDHPEIFWLPPYYVTALGKDKEGNSTALMMFSSSSEISPAYMVSRSEKAYMEKELESAVEEIASLVTAETPFEIELQLHDLLCSRVEYSNDKEDGMIYTAYGALVGGKAICEGYSRAMQLLLSRFGILSTTVTGIAEGEGHMWNMVNIEGGWYNLDVTWNDSAGEFISHEYFNVTDAEISLDHTFSKDYTGIKAEELAKGQTSFNISRPLGTALDADYFVKCGFFYTPYKMDILAELLINGGEEVLEVKFADTATRDDFLQNYAIYVEQINAEIALISPEADFYIGATSVSTLTMKLYKTKKDSEISESF